METLSPWIRFPESVIMTQPQNPYYPPQQQTQVAQPQQPQYYQAQQPAAQPYPQQYAQATPAQPMMTPQMMSFLSMLLIAIGAVIAGIGWMISAGYTHIIIGLGYLIAGVGVLLMALQKNKMI